MNRLNASYGVGTKTGIAEAKGYLDLTLDFPNVRQVILWSLTDRISNMNRPGYPDYKRRADGLPLRGHPYDEHRRRSESYRGGAGLGVLGRQTNDGQMALVRSATGKMPSRS